MEFLKGSKVKREMNLEEVRQYILKCSRESSFYLGSDSERYKSHGGVWVADYTIVVACHIDSRHGCKVFGQIETAQDYDQRKDKPAMRLMGEVHRVAVLFDQLRDVLQDRNVEIHLDVNSSKIHNSNIVASQAIGYIKGTCDGIEAKLKPLAFCASFGADRYSEICN